MSKIKTILKTVWKGIDEDFASIKVPVFAMAIMLAVFIGKAVTLQSIVNQCNEPNACKLAPEAVASIAATLPSEWIQLAVGVILTVGVYGFTIVFSKKEEAEAAAKAALADQHQAVAVSPKA